MTDPIVVKPVEKSHGWNPNITDLASAIKKLEEYKDIWLEYEKVYTLLGSLFNNWKSVSIEEITNAINKLNERLNSTQTAEEEQVIRKILTHLEKFLQDKQTDESGSLIGE